MNNYTPLDILTELREIKNMLKLKAATPKKPRPQTLNRGAADARALCKDAIRAELKLCRDNLTTEDVLIAETFAKQIIKRINAQAKNASKRPGGLGRKRK